MFDGIDPLAALRDIREPAPSWWSSHEWLALIACAVAAACVWYWWSRRRGADPRRAALKELALLRRRHAAGEAAGVIIAELAVLLRRFALVRYPRAVVAGLCGSKWTGFLQSQVTPETSRAIDPRVFAWAPYSRNPRINTADSLAMTESLIECLNAHRDSDVPLDKPRAHRRTEHLRLFSARRRLRSACLADDARAARRALLDWATLAWQAPPREIKALGVRLGDDALCRALAELDYALYAPDAEAWRGRELWRRASRALKSRPRRRAAASSLPPLYG